MALNVAQLMSTPNGTGAISNYPGAVKSGAGTSVSTTDGSINLVPPTATVLGGVREGSGVTIDPNGVISATGSGVASITAGTGINVSGTTNITISQRAATTSTIGGIKPGTGTTVSGDGTLNVTGFLPLTGGTINSGGGTGPGTVLIQSPLASPGPCPLLLLKGPGQFPPDTGFNTSFMLACYDSTHNIGCSWRYYDPDPNAPGSDTKFSNQVATDEDNLWCWSARQLRLNSDLSTGTNLFSFFQYGSGPNGGRLVAYITSSGQYIIQNGAVGGSQYYAPPVALTGNALDQVNALTPQSWTYAIQPVDTETGDPVGPVVPSDTFIGFTPEDVETNCPVAYVPDAEVEGSETMGGGVNYNAIFVTAVQAIQELSQQLDTLRQEFDDYVATHP
jgi:hypothetical protein